MRFALEIRTENAAFVDDVKAELSAMLRAVALRLETDREDPGCHRNISDVNGNKVGAWSFYSS